MAVVLARDDNGRDDENAEVIDGRPDLGDFFFGVTDAKKFPPYVFGVRGGSCLVHRIRRVRYHWYRVAAGGSKLVRMKRPVAIADTMCAQSFRLEGAICRTCQVPSPDALSCGRCDGIEATFAKRKGYRVAGLTREEAHVKLGCVVKGY